MKTALSELHELVQKQIIETPEYLIESSGNDHQKTFTCRIKLNGFNDFAATASGKDKARRKAADLLLTHLKATVDLTKKRQTKNISQACESQDIANTTDQNSENPISALLELSQKGMVAEASYKFLNTSDKQQGEYECICSIGNLTTNAFSISKKKAKKAAAMSMLLALQDKNMLITAEKKPASIHPKTTLNTCNSVSWLMEAKQINHIETLNYHYRSLDNATYECTCQADQFKTQAEASSKKTAKIHAAEKMMELLNDNNYSIGEKTFKQQHLVEPNACGEWIRSICPGDVDLRRLSWYLDNDCVVLHLGLKRSNTKSSVEAFKRRVEQETRLLVLVNRYRDAKKAIESLQTVAEKDGCIYDHQAIDRIALGSYFKPRQYPEPEICWHKRHDHTKDHCFTIDSKTSVDLDDAFSINTENPNAIIVYVHIADVSFLIAERTSEDKKARNQCFSYYGASKQLPMISNQMMYQASLLPQKDRMAWTIKMVITPEADITEYRIYPSVIRSKFRLDQKMVSLLIGHTTHQHSHDFKLMGALSDKLIAKRLSKGGVNSFTEETSGYLLVQEFMLLANRCVAEFCINNNIAIPFRVHQFPDDSMDIRKIYNQAQNHNALLPFLGRANYSATASTHEALAFDHYCHFTSPIRRYADLLLQRQLKRFYFGENLRTDIELAEVIENINQQEQLLEMSQTTIRYVERLQVQFRQAGKRLEAVVDEVANDHYRLKALSVKCDYSMRLFKKLCDETLSVGSTVFVILLAKYHVMDECFDCKPV